MSWFVSYEVDNKDATDEGEKTLQEFLANGEGVWSEETKEQIIQALIQGIALIESGVVGNPYGAYVVSLGGYANPKHEPNERANDMVTITVAQRSKE